MNKSIHIHKFEYFNLLIPLIITAIVFLIVESLLHVQPIISRMPSPSPGLPFAFPEVGIKIKRYFLLEKVNCLFFGSSMVDTGLDPQTMSSVLHAETDQDYECFNFGISGSMVETSNKISHPLVDWQDTKLIILGISPIEFNEQATKIRAIGDYPVFNQDKNPTIEGWLLNSSRLPWFYYGMLNKKNKSFKSNEKSYDSLINSHGLRVHMTTNPDGQIEEYLLHDFYPNPVDMNAMNEMIVSAKAKDTQIFIVEMPVRPSYLANLVEGGSSMYEQRYIQPVQQLLAQNGIELIRTQPQIEKIVSSDDWINKNHLNYSGAQKLTRYVADQIINIEFGK